MGNTVLVVRMWARALAMLAVREYRTWQFGRKMKARHSQLVMELIEKAQFIGDRLPSGDAGLLETLIISAMSPCPVEFRGGMIGRDQDGAEVSTGYAGSAKYSCLCRMRCEKKCNGHCYGRPAVFFLRNNTHDPKSLRGGTVFASNYPSRQEIKILYSLGVKKVYTLFDDHDDDAVVYYDRLRGRGVDFEIEKLEFESEVWREYFLFAHEKLGKIKTPLSFGDAGILLSVINGRRSHCIYHHIGSFIYTAREGFVVSGYNGPASGDVHCDEDGCQKKIDGVKCIGLHGEENGLNKLSDTTLVRGGVIFISQSACEECAISIADVGIKAVVFLKKYQRVVTNNNRVTDTSGQVRAVSRDAGISMLRYSSRGLTPWR